jgi:hypothetical protein
VYGGVSEAGDCETGSVQLLHFWEDTGIIQSKRIDVRIDDWQPPPRSGSCFVALDAHSVLMWSGGARRVQPWFRHCRRRTMHVEHECFEALDPSFVHILTLSADPDGVVRGDWSSLSPAGPAPLARAFAACALVNHQHGQSLWCFGGETANALNQREHTEDGGEGQVTYATKYFGDVCRLDISISDRGQHVMEWKVFSETATRSANDILRRHYDDDCTTGFSKASCVADAAGRIYLLGGVLYHPEVQRDDDEGIRGEEESWVSCHSLSVFDCRPAPDDRIPAVTVSLPNLGGFAAASAALYFSDADAGLGANIVLTGGMLYQFSNDDLAAPDEDWSWMRHRPVLVEQLCVVNTHEMLAGAANRRVRPATRTALRDIVRERNAPCCRYLHTSVPLVFGENLYVAIIGGLVPDSEEDGDPDWISDATPSNTVMVLRL